MLTEPDLGKLLPVQPFLACAHDVMARLGKLRLEAVQVLLPEPRRRHGFAACLAIGHAGRELSAVCLRLVRRL